MVALPRVSLQIKTETKWKGKKKKDGFREKFSRRKVWVAFK